MGYQFGQAKENYVSVEINGQSYPLKLGSKLVEAFEDAGSVIKDLPSLGSAQDVRDAEEALIGILERIFGEENTDRILDSAPQEPQLEDLMGLLTYIQEDFIERGKEAKAAAPADNRETRRAAERKARRTNQKTSLEVVD